MQKEKTILENFNKKSIFEQREIVKIAEKTIESLYDEIERINEIIIEKRKELSEIYERREHCFANEIWDYDKRIEEKINKIKEYEEEIRQKEVEIKRQEEIIQDFKNRFADIEKLEHYFYKISLIEPIKLLNQKLKKLNKLND